MTKIEEKIFAFTQCKRSFKRTSLARVWPWVMTTATTPQPWSLRLRTSCGILGISLSTNQIYFLNFSLCNLVQHSLHTGKHIRTDYRGHSLRQEKHMYLLQESIPVGCVPPACWPGRGGSFIAPPSWNHTLSMTPLSWDTHPQSPHLWTEWLTDVCENIYLPATTVAGRKKNTIQH